MTIHYNLYRFGPDEFAVAHLINGDFPEDDEERWKIVDAPRYRIQRLLDEHLRAQTVLRDYQQSGKPFVLFLRSFSSEHKPERLTHEKGQVVGTQFSLHPVVFQQWLKLQVSVPIVKLHGGSDPLLSDRGDQETLASSASVLSTHSANWKAVAEELIQAAPAIIFLVSHLTAGVVEEFDLIRKSGRMDRCLVVVLDASTLVGGPGDVMQIRTRLADFPSVFELRTPDSYPTELGAALTGLLQDPKSEASLNQALNAEFTYLEPGFTESEDFAWTERRIWRQLRLLRVMFDETYWAALRSHGIAFEHFTFAGAWEVAHKIYGLAIATMDFRAIREALSYLGLLYIFRGADYALVFPHLAAQYSELAAKIFPTREPDTEAQYASGPDPLKVPAKIDTAIKLVELAETAGSRQDSETAIYLYQAAVICALRSTDGDDRERRWIIANMCRDWATFQGTTPELEWAVTNCGFAVKLFRDLAAADPDQYKGGLALCLNNLGSLHFRQRRFPAADAAFVEALDIRRKIPSESEDYMVDLCISLSNLGLLRVEVGELDSGRALYSEALAVCEKRLSSDPKAIVDLTRVQGWMSLCLAQAPDTAHQGLAYAQRAASNLARVSQVSPESEPGLRKLVDAAVRATSEIS